MTTENTGWVLNGEELSILAKRTFVEVGKKLDSRKYQKAFASMVGGVMALEARVPDSPLLKEGIIGAIIRSKKNIEEGLPFSDIEIYEFNVLLDTWVEMPRWFKLLAWIIRK